MTPPPTPAGPPQAHPMRRFLNFWFAPADPTILGFIRVVTGCLVVYAHAAYTPDLFHFFGKDAWYDLAAADRDRHQFPYVVPGLDWEDPLRPVRGAQVPEYPHRRAVLMAYLRGVLGDGPAPAPVDAKLAYLDRFLKADDDLVKRQDAATGGNVSEAVVYASFLKPDPRDRADQLEVLGDESLKKARSKDAAAALPATPNLAAGLSPADRAKLPAEAEAFFATLPAAESDRAVVLTHYREMDHFQRLAFVKFIHRIAMLEPAVRDADLDYLNYWNVDPAVTTRVGNPVFSIWYHITDPREMQIAHAVMLLVFVLFTLGICTRVTSVLTWLAALSYVHRSMQILFGMDTMMLILLFYLMIGDSGAALSVDRVVYRYRAARRSIAAHGRLDGPTLAFLAAPPASVTAGFALRLIQVHFCFIYMASGLAKLKGAAWWNTNAYWDTLANPEFTPIFYKWYEHLLREVVSVRPVYAVMAAVGVGFTFICEIGLPILVWTRARPVVVMMGILLHTGIALFMGLVVFSLFMLTMLLAYLPGVAVRGLLFGRTVPPDRVRVSFTPAVPAQRRAAALVAALDFDGQVDLLPTAADAGSLTVEVAGRTLAGAAAGRELADRVTLLRLVRLAVGLDPVARRLVAAGPAGNPAKPVATAAGRR